MEIYIHTERVNEKRVGDSGIVAISEIDIIDKKLVKCGIYNTELFICFPSKLFFLK